MLLKIDTRQKFDRTSTPAEMEGQAGRERHEAVNTATGMFLFVLCSLSPADFSGCGGYRGTCVIVTLSW